MSERFLMTIVLILVYDVFFECSKIHEPKKMVILPSIDLDFRRQVFKVSTTGLFFELEINQLRSLSSIAILAKAERQAEEMSKDWYAFNGLPKDKVERARNFERRNWPKINVDNKDWEIIINTKDPSQDPDLKN